MARHAARRVALQKIYARMVGGGDCDSVLEGLPDFENIAEDQEYINQACEATLTESERFDELITKLSPQRALERIPVLDRAILHLALYELAKPDDPSSVVINEAVELAKRYGEEADSRFINGVLGKVVREQLV